MKKRITAPLSEETVQMLKAGDTVLLSGVLYTARDAAHKRMCEALERGGPIPFSLEGAVIYYVGPTPAKPGRIIGSAGPTTSGRMDAYTPKLLQCGLKGMIGKGQRTSEVIDAIVANRAVYFAATGGAGALLASRIKSSQVIAWEDLGTEAVRRLEVEDFPLTVVIDREGRNLYDIAVEEFREQQSAIDCRGSNGNV